MGEKYRGEFPDWSRSLDTPRQQMKREFGDLAMRLRETGDPLCQEIAEKIEGKLEIKEMADRYARYLGDTTQVYSLSDRDNIYLCGIFILKKAQAKLDWSYPALGFELKKGETFYDLHLPPQNVASWSVRNIENSLKLMADFMSHDSLPAKYLVGISYDAIIDRPVVRRMGFGIVNPDASVIPEEVRDSLARFFQGAPEVGERLRRKISGYAMCFTSTGDFVAKWGGVKHSFE